MSLILLFVPVASSNASRSSTARSSLLHSLSLRSNSLEQPTTFESRRDTSRDLSCWVSRSFSPRPIVVSALDEGRVYSSTDNFPSTRLLSFRQLISSCTITGWICGVWDVCLLVWYVSALFYPLSIPKTDFLCSSFFLASFRSSGRSPSFVPPLAFPFHLSSD